MKSSLIKILVTGGAGFIGSNLCEELIRLGNQVICLDNFSTGKMENIEELLIHPNFKLITGDIRNLNDCNLAVRANRNTLGISRKFKFHQPNGPSSCTLYRGESR